MPRKQNKGFTLLEILLVIAAIGILAAIVLVAINPNKQIEAARQAKRRTDINTITKAIQQYSIDNNGQYPTGIDTGAKPICNPDNTPVGCVNLSTALSPTYIASIPTADSNRYYVRKNTAGTSIEVTHPRDDIWNIGGVPSLDLNFANNRSLIDGVSGSNLISFTRSGVTGPDTDGTEAADLPQSGKGATYFDGDGIMRYAEAGKSRFDHNPTTRESLGLLVEEQRTNLAFQSEDLATTWSLQTATVTTNAVASPANTATAEKLIVNNAAVLGAANQTFTKDASAITYTFSVFAKASEHSIIRLIIRDPLTSNNRADVVFSLSSKAFSAPFVGGTYSGHSYSFVEYANGWVRVIMTATTGVETGLQVQLINNTPGNGTSGLFFWGAQLEAGYGASSYIPTTTAQVTRAKDIATISGTNFTSWYQQAEGTIFAEYIGGRNYVYNAYGRIATTDVWSLEKGANAFATNFITGPSQISSVSLVNSFVSPSKVAAAWQGSAISTVIADGNLPSFSSGSLAISGTATKLNIGTDTNGNIALDGTIARLTYWPTRLSNTTLQNITK